MARLVVQASSSNQDFFGLEALKPTQAPPPMMGGGAAAPIMSNGMGAGVRNSMTGGPMGSNRPMNGGPMGGGPMGGGMNAMGGSRGSSNSNLYGMGQGMPFQKNPYSQNDPFNDLSGLQPGGASPSTQGNRGRSY